MKNKPIQIIPYLPFHGNCEEALQTYLAAFGGQMLYLSRWSENTCGAAQELIGKVMHAEFLLGSTRMSGGDSSEVTEISPTIKLMVHMDSMEEAEHTLSVLAEGGAVLSPLKPHPQPDDAGCGASVRDRFGYTWFVTCPNPAKQ